MTIQNRNHAEVLELLCTLRHKIIVKCTQATGPTKYFIQKMILALWYHHMHISMRKTEPIFQFGNKPWKHKKRNILN